MTRLEKKWPQLGTNPKPPAASSQGVLKGAPGVVIHRSATPTQTTSLYCEEHRKEGDKVLFQELPQLPQTSETATSFRHETAANKPQKLSSMYTREECMEELDSCVVVRQDGKRGNTTLDTTI